MRRHVQAMLASHKGALLKLGGEDVALALKRLLQEVDDVDTVEHNMAL